MTKAAEFIKGFEGFSPTPYLCPAGVLTIGYGHTGTDVVHGMYITREQADTMLDADLTRFAQQMYKFVKVPLNDNQEAALLSFVYNLGVGALEMSTLLKRLNEGNYDLAADEFLKWVYAKDPVDGRQRELPGLITRQIGRAHV